MTISSVTPWWYHCRSTVSFFMGEIFFRRLMVYPCQSNVRINPCDVDQLVRIQNSEPSIVKFEDTLFAQILKHAIDVDASETSCVPNMLLSERKAHLFTAMTRPPHPRSHEQLKKQIRDAFLRRAPANSRQMIVREIALL